MSDGLDPQSLWKRHKLNHDPIARRELIDQHAYLVKITAGRMIHSDYLRGEAGDDLLSDATIGLIYAVDHYDPLKRVKFTTYAIAVIRGMLLQAMRNLDWCPRVVREQGRALSDAFAALEATFGRAPSAVEVQRYLGMDQDTYEHTLMMVGRAQILSLDDVLTVSANSEDRRVFQDYLAMQGLSPFENALIQERKGRLVRAINRLPDRERLVISLYYFDGLTFKEVSVVLGVSESRAYQLHTQALIRLNNRLDSFKELLAGAT